MYNVNSKLLIEYRKVKTERRHQMPQIHMTLTSHAHGVLASKLRSLALKLVSTVEKAWRLEGFSDVAFTALPPALFVLGENDIQIEIRYTAGEDEYDRGEPFDPSSEEQGRLAKQIRQVFLDFFSNHNLECLSLSVWCKPYYHSVFEEFE